MLPEGRAAIDASIEDSVPYAVRMISVIVPVHSAAANGCGTRVGLMTAYRRKTVVRHTKSCTAELICAHPRGRVAVFLPRHASLPITAMMLTLGVSVTGATDFPCVPSPD